MRNFVVGFVALVGGLAISAFGQNRVIFDNQSGDPAVVKLIGPTQAQVEVPNGAKVGTDATPGRYIIKVRYGTPGNYRYSKGEEFSVSETATARSETTITLHKVVAGNYDARPISEKDFQDSRVPPATRPNPIAASKDRTWSVFYHLVPKVPDKDSVLFDMGITAAGTLSTGAGNVRPQIVEDINNIKRTFGAPDKIDKNQERKFTAPGGVFNGQRIPDVQQVKGDIWTYGGTELMVQNEKVTQIWIDAPGHTDQIFAPRPTATAGAVTASRRAVARAMFIDWGESDPRLKGWRGWAIYETELPNVPKNLEGCTVQTRSGQLIPKNQHLGEGTFKKDGKETKIFCFLANEASSNDLPAAILYDGKTVADVEVK